MDFFLIDYLAPVIFGVVFAIGVLILSFISNYCCINKHDEVTKFEEFGAKRNFRLGRPLRKVKKMLADRIITDDEEFFRGEKAVLTD